MTSLPFCLAHRGDSIVCQSVLIADVLVEVRADRSGFDQGRVDGGGNVVVAEPVPIGERDEQRHRLWVVGGARDRAAVMVGNDHVLVLSVMAV